MGAKDVVERLGAVADVVVVNAIVAEAVDDVGTDVVTKDRVVDRLVSRAIN